MYKEFDRHDGVKPKKIKSKMVEEPTLKLEDEEPLILEEVHQEPVVQKREKKISNI